MCLMKNLKCISMFQIRRSFLEELGINKNWSVVDMIFREFYTGSDEDLSPSERGLLESMFSTQAYVEREIEYGYMTKMGAVNKTALKNWKGYLKKYGKYILRGTHFTNFAVQVKLFRKKKGFCSTLCTREMFQNLSYYCPCTSFFFIFPLINACVIVNAT